MPDPAVSAVACAVSVVIPVRDDADHLRRCLDALRAQIRPADEVIVVDDGSTDASAAVARNFGAVVVSSPGRGIPAASAHGYDTARGQVVLRLDADCIPDPAWIESVLDIFHRNPRISVLTGGARFIDGPRALRGPLAIAYLLTYAVVCGIVLGHLPLFGSNLAFRRSVWLVERSNAHHVDGRLHDDLDLSFHFGERHRIRPMTHRRMGMSMRPFSSASAMHRRIKRGFRTVHTHWPQDYPPVRWARLLLRRVLHVLGVPTLRSRGAR